MKNNTATETTLQTSNDLRHTISVNDSTGNYSIKIRLNDECKNGHQDFSTTATFWEVGKVRSDKNLITGGCCHEEILKVRPDLQIFVNLHLCDYSGVPMYAVENGFYHLQNGFNSTKVTDNGFADEFCSYYRITPKQFAVLCQSENKLRYALNLQSLGILEQWKAEAYKAIALLEKLTNTKFIVDSKKTQFNAPTPEQVAKEQEKEKNGYYTPEKIAERKQQAEAAAKAKQYADIKAEMNKEIAKARKEYEVKKMVLDAGLTLDNFIYYNHTKQGVFNWKNYGEQVTKQEFEKFLSTVAPSNITWKLGK